ncbi:MAG: NADH-quinone oxidoreductase subunit C [Planctomycetota bacterium]|nr:NADH-quinone oxidoreductase subunit C [Planctomycetota bacterium]MDI6788523.1 NADH-quinone oxidoreductase subunit C [Planctomycetota bacterium]
MNIQEIADKLKARFGESVNFQDNPLAPFVRVKVDTIVQVAQFLKETPDLYFDSLMSLTCVDYPANFTIVYHLFSMRHLYKVILKVEVPKDNAMVSTVENIWRAANWFEREIYDLFGVKFEGHPNLIRILLPDDWEGHPLRKDYQYPATYHGVPL